MNALPRPSRARLALVVFAMSTTGALFAVFLRVSMRAPGWNPAQRQEAHRILTQDDRLRENVEAAREVWEAELDLSTESATSILRNVSESLAHSALRASSGPRDSRRSARDDWNRFPRTHFDLRERACTTPHTIQCRQLFRHVVLNPRDRIVPPELRPLLCRIVQMFVPMLREIDIVARETTRRELSTLLRYGMAREIEPWRAPIRMFGSYAFASNYAIPSGSTVSSNVPITDQRTGVVSARTDLLVHTHSLRSLLAERGRILMFYVVDYFTAVGCLTPIESYEIKRVLSS